jgi:multisubunit Na+/H+ antiporter MnhG subunit
VTPTGQPPSRRDKRLYFVLMGTCIGLFVVSWAVVDRYSLTAAVIISVVALVIPPFAAIIANAASAADRKRRLPRTAAGPAQRRTDADY